jgi:hypothetical protein
MEARQLALFVLDLQKERSQTALQLYMSTRSGAKNSDLTATYEDTDRSLASIEWKSFGGEKIFSSKLRFQIKLDDFRYIPHMWDFAFGHKIMNCLSIGSL